MTDLNSVNDIFEKKFNIEIESKTGDKITDKKIHFLSQYTTIQN